MDILTKRTCVTCGEEKELSLFKTSIASYNKKRYFRKECKTCWNFKNKSYGDPEKRASRVSGNNKRKQQKIKHQIVAFDPLTIARRIVNDSRRSDRNKGRDHDLDLDFILEQIQHDCSYCDRPSTSCRMTLDRVNNDLGHTKDNVIPSCQTCNMVRGNMPYDAWLHVAPGMKSARLAGLLDGWDGPRLNRKTVLDSE